MIDIETAKRLCSAATAGPWKEIRCDHASPTEACGVYAPTAPRGESGKLGTSVFCDAAYDECHHVVSLADAEFIAAARALVPALIDEVERLRGALADVKSALDCDNRYPSTQANTANLRAWTIVHEAMR